MTTTLAPPQIPFFTVEEYFELEQDSETRHEFVNGKIFDMPGEYLPNVTIAKNCIVRLTVQFETKSSNCMVYNHVTKLKVSPTAYRYPDVVVTCAPETDFRFVQFPSLIIEVLSESTQRTDRKDKLTEYCNIASLHYYLLIEPDEMSVEMYRRDGEKWVYSAFSNADDCLSFPVFEAELYLKDIYKNIALGNPQTDAPPNPSVPRPPQA